MISVRCSSLDRLDECQASAVEPGTRIDLAGDAADIGTAVHEVLAMSIAAGDLIDHGATARRLDLDEDELGTLCGIAWGTWRKVADYFPNPLVEYRLPTFTDPRGLVLTGTADLVAQPGGLPTTGILLDFKSGWGDCSHSQQLRGYAFLLARSNGYDIVRASVLKIRHGRIETQEWTRKELDSWWHDLGERILKGQNTYRPSFDACRFCPRAMECEAHAALIRSSASALSEVDPGSLSTDPEFLVSLHRRAKAVASVCESALAAIKLQVQALGGSVETSNGTRLSLRTVERREIVPAPAWPILSEALGERLPEAISVSKTKAEKIVRDSAPPRGKAKAAAEFMERLEAAGAIERKTSERLEITRAEHSPEAVSDESSMSE